MGPVARNFAQLVFLAYGLWMIFHAGRVVKSLLLARMGEKKLEESSRGFLNKLCFLQVKKRVPPLFYWLNLTALCLFALDLFLQLTVGWFALFSLLTKIINSLTVIVCGLYAYLAALVDSMMRHDKLFILYDWDPDSDKLFSSGILDILLFVAGPVAIVLSNFLALK